MSFSILKLIQKTVFYGFLLLSVPLFCAKPRVVAVPSSTAIVPYRSPFLPAARGYSRFDDITPYVPRKRYSQPSVVFSRSPLPARLTDHRDDDELEDTADDEDDADDADDEGDEDYSSFIEQQKISNTLAAWERRRPEYKDFMKTVRRWIAGDFQSLQNVLKVQLMLILVKFNDEITEYKRPSEDDSRDLLADPMVEKVKEKWKAFFDRVKSKYVAGGWPVAEVVDRKNVRRKTGNFQIFLSQLQKAFYEQAVPINILVNFARIFTPGKMTLQYYHDLKNSIDGMLLVNENWVFAAYRFLRRVIEELEILRAKNVDSEEIAGLIDEFDAITNDLKEVLTDGKKTSFITGTLEGQKSEVERLKIDVISRLDEIEDDAQEVAKVRKLNVEKILRLFYSFNQMLLRADSAWINVNSPSVRNMLNRMYRFYDSVVKMGPGVSRAEDLFIFLQELVRTHFLIDCCSSFDSVFKKCVSTDIELEKNLKKKYAELCDRLCSPHQFASPDKQEYQLFKFEVYYDPLVSKMDDYTNSLENFVKSLWSFFPHVRGRNDKGELVPARCVVVRFDYPKKGELLTSDKQSRRSPAGFEFKVDGYVDKAVVVPKTDSEKDLEVVEKEVINWVGSNPDAEYDKFVKLHDSLSVLVSSLREPLTWKSVNRLNLISVGLMHACLTADMLLHSEYKKNVGAKPDYKFDGFWNNFVDVLRAKNVEKASSFKIKPDEFYLDKRTTGQKQSAKDGFKAIQFILRKIIEDFFLFKASSVVSEKTLEKINKLYNDLFGQKLLVGNVLMRKMIDAQRLLLSKIRAQIDTPAGIATLTSLFETKLDEVKWIADSMVDNGLRDELIELIDSSEKVDSFTDEVLSEWRRFFGVFLHTSKTSAVRTYLKDKGLLSRKFGLSLGDLKKRDLKITDRLDRYALVEVIKPLDHGLPKMNGGFHSFENLNKWHRLRIQLDNLFQLDDIKKLTAHKSLNGFNKIDGEGYPYDVVVDEDSWESSQIYLKQYVLAFAKLLIESSMLNFRRFLPREILTAGTINYIAALYFEYIKNKVDPAFTNLFVALVRRLDTRFSDLGFTREIWPITHAVVVATGIKEDVADLPTMVGELEKTLPTVSLSSTPGLSPGGY